jgi:hypothetical protein
MLSPDITIGRVIQLTRRLQSRGPLYRHNAEKQTVRHHYDKSNVKVNLNNVQEKKQ